MSEALKSASVIVSEAELEAAVRDGVITGPQSRQLWERWVQLARVQATVPGGLAPGPRFGFTNVLYYFGGMVAIGAMTLFMTLGWHKFGDWGLLAIALAYLVACLLVADNLKGRGLGTPAGILATLAVCLVPLALWALQSGLGQWPPGGPSSYRAYHTHIDWRWLTLEFGTLAAAVVMLWRYRLPFMVMPVAVTVWYMYMDVASLLMQQAGFEYKFMRDMSLVFGIGTCLMAMWVDMRSRLASGEWRQDFAFWLYIFGTIMFWCGLSLQDSGSEWGKALYALINIGLVFLGAAIGRRVFTVFGAFGVAGYLAYLSHRVFRDSMLFPFALTLLGLAVVALGIWWQRHEKQIEARLSAWLPAGLRPRQ